MSAPPSSIAETLPQAGVVRRLAALVYDAFLLFGLLVVPLFVLTALRGKATLANDSVAHDLPPIAPAPLMLVYMIVVICGFYWYFWRRSGQTLGMQAWRLRLDNAAGARASLRQCAIRSAVGLLALLAGGLGYWWIWVDRDGLSWHDRASGTRVVVVPKRKR